MHIAEALADFFKPEDRKRGADLFNKDVVVISSASDTDVRAFIKATGACKVTLMAEDVVSSSFSADCSCPAAAKGMLCKHIWAVLLKLESKGYDFLESKQAVEKVSKVTPQKAQSTVRQDDFKKLQYERQKLRNKEIRREKKQSAAAAAFSYPPDVEEARAYFAQNGFDLTHPLDLEALNAARKLLARVFHPDKGGTHAETLQLNEHFEAIRSYLKS